MLDRTSWNKSPIAHILLAVEFEEGHSGLQLRSRARLHLRCLWQVLQLRRLWRDSLRPSSLHGCELCEDILSTLVVIQPNSLLPPFWPHGHCLMSDRLLDFSRKCCRTHHVHFLCTERDNWRGVGEVLEHWLDCHGGSCFLLCSKRNPCRSGQFCWQAHSTEGLGELLQEAGPAVEPLRSLGVGLRAGPLHRELQLVLGCIHKLCNHASFVANQADPVCQSSNFLAIVALLS
mmetsp:Transcript_45668/g.74188  ORF Transcript_45668/g.74188 Transcript_45668/m.74188 type:complete len:232 (-) Transcript_45668:1261-1956(-)